MNKNEEKMMVTVVGRPKGNYEAEMLIRPQL